MGLSNASVPHLNYPTQVMFKSCKLIPVLIGGILIQGIKKSILKKHFSILKSNIILILGKRFNKYDVSASIMMSIGLIFFTLADVQIQPNFHLIGVVLIVGALCADAAIGNVQEKQMKLHKASNIEVVLYSYSIGFLYILIGEIFFDNLSGAFVFWSQVINYFLNKSI